MRRALLRVIERSGPLAVGERARQVSFSGPHRPGGDSTNSLEPKEGVDAVAKKADSSESAPVETVAKPSAPEKRPIWAVPDIPVTSSSGLDPNKFYDDAPVRATGKWQVKDVVNPELKSVEFRTIDDIESELQTSAEGRQTALVVPEDEDYWKNKLMFVHKFRKTPKHLTWKELGQEIECLDCVIDLDDHRPEEVFTMKFYFINRRSGTRDEIWSATNDVSNSEALTDLLAAIGSCLGRSDVHRTIRFDSGNGVTREINLRKRSRYTSDLVLAFRPEVRFNNFERIEATSNWEKQMEEEGFATWGFHPSLMDPEYRDTADPEGTYHLTMSAHGFSFVINRAITRLLSRPMKDFYRPSQVMKTMRLEKKEDLGVQRALMGWLGLDAKIYPHYTPMEAIQEHWFGADAPFTLTAIVNKVREMTYLKPQNPEFQSWLSVRQRDSATAVRNVRAKLMGAGASPLFAPMSHNATVNQLLPREQRRDVAATVSLGGLVGLPDETRKLDELRAITGVHKITDSSSSTADSTSTTAEPGPSTGSSTTGKP